MSRLGCLLSVTIVLVIAYHACLGDAFLERKRVNCFEDPVKCQDIYDGIDFFLIAHIDSDDVHENMDAIEEWIARESFQKPTRKSASRISALVLLRDLVTTDGPGRCKPSTGQLLHANDIALRGALSKLEPGQTPPRRIEKIVHYYASAYMRDCDFVARVKRFNQRGLQNIRDFIGELIGSHAVNEKFFMFQAEAIDPTTFVDDQPRAAASFARTMKIQGTKRDITILYHWLNTIANRYNDSLGKTLGKIFMNSGEAQADGANIQKLFRKHMTRPCEDYVDRFEVLFKNTWTLTQSRKLHKSQGDESELDKNMAYYYGCVKFLEKESLLSEGVEAMVKSASARAVQGAKSQKKI